MPDIVKPSFFSRVNRWHRAVGDDVAADELLVDIKFEAPISGDELDFEIRSPVPGTLLEIARQAGESVDAGARLGVIGVVDAPPRGFTVTFDSTIVTFSRPWWDEIFLSSGNWTVPGFSRGQVSSGDLGQPAASAISLITSGMVVIRNLQITSNWGDEERAQLTSGALNLGPFSLAGAGANGETLSRPGAQAIGWICQVPPVLPPASDPALPPT